MSTTTDQSESFLAPFPPFFRVSIFSPFYGSLLVVFPFMIIKAALVSLCPCHDLIARGEVASSAIDAIHPTYPHDLGTYPPNLPTCSLPGSHLISSHWVGLSWVGLQSAVCIFLNIPRPSLGGGLLSVCHLRSVPQAGCHRVALEGFHRVAFLLWRQMPRLPEPLPRPDKPQQTLLLLLSSSEEGTMPD